MKIETRQNISTKLEVIGKQLFQLTDLVEKTQKEVSHWDCELSNIYHIIEGKKITHISQSHALIKEMKHILSKRREAKGNQRMVHSMVAVYSNFKNTKNRIIKKEKQLKTSMEKNANK